MLCYAMLCYVMLCYVMLWYGMFCYGMVWYGMVCYVMLWYGMVWYVIVCYAMLCYALLCYAMLYYGMVWYIMSLTVICWLYFQVSDDFIRELHNNNITVMSQEIFLHDPYTRVQNLKVTHTFIMLYGMSNGYLFGHQYLLNKNRVLQIEF